MKGTGKHQCFSCQKIQNLIEEGMELGEADDFVFKEKTLKKKDGAVGILTNGFDRQKKVL